MRTTIVHYIEQAIAPWQGYTSHSVFLASFAMSLLYLTVLSFGTTMVTYLLHTGFSPMEVSSMRIGSVVAELSGTWAAPFIMDRIGPIRSGLWFLNWQSACLAAAAAGFVFLDAGSRMVAIILIVSVALSRIGLWGFDLSVQFLVQEVITLSLTCPRSILIGIYRASKNMPERDSPLPRWHCRTFSNFYPLLPPSSSLCQSNSNILY